MTQTIKFVWLGCVLALMHSGPSPADEEKDDDALHCIKASLIRQTKVVDDSRILFYLRGKSIYQNILPRRCRGLSREGRFSYHIATGSLCRLDTIRILYHGGAGLQEGAACGLGYFHEVTEEDVESMLEDLSRPPQAKPLPPADPEEIIKETEES